MAEPIPFSQPPRSEADDAERLRDVRAKHAEAIHSASELLQLLHDRGVLDLLRGAVGAGDKLAETVSQAVNTPASIRAIRNFVLLTKIFGSIRPEVFSGLAEALAAGAGRERSRKAPGLLALIWRLRNEDTRRALAVALDLIESLGKGF